MAAAKRPDLVAGMVLVDPAIVPRRERVLARMKFRNGGGFALALNAAKRRADWPDDKQSSRPIPALGRFKPGRMVFLSLC